MRVRSRAMAALGLAALAGLGASLAPFTGELRPQPLVSLALWALRRVLSAAGLRGPPPLYALGAFILWGELCLCLFTQPTVFSLPPGALWVPRGLLLTSALLVWLWLHAPPSWLWRGAVAGGSATCYVLLMLGVGAPPVG